MRNCFVLLVSLISLGAHGVLSASNVTIHMEDYITQNQRQYDARLKKLDDELTLYKERYKSELRAISVQADQMQLKLESAAEHFNPIELIDAWHKQCVQNYTAKLPTADSLRAPLNTCSSSAQTNINSYIQTAQNTYNNMKSYYANNFKNLLNDCEKRHPNSQTNYTNCITAAIATANTYTINTQKSFTTLMQTATCSADSRITQAWECAFNIVYSNSAALGVAMRLVDDCIANVLSCASVACNAGCKNHMIIGLSANDFQNTTISNPFFGLNSNIGCMEMKIKIK